MFKINIADATPIDLSNVYETLNQEIITQSTTDNIYVADKSVLDFMLLSFNDDKKKNISMFTDGKHLEIQFRDLNEIYQKFTIYRTKMFYLSLINKMHLLESIKIINYDNGDKFMKLFHYDEMKLQAETLEIFLRFYFNFNIITACLGDLISIFKYLKDSNINNMIIRENNFFINKIKNKLKIFDYYFSVFNEKFNKYLPSIKNLLCFIEDKLVDVKNFEYFKDNYEKHIDSCKLELEKSQIFVSNVLNDFDTKIECTYFIAFGNYENKIAIKGISNYIYMDANELYDLTPKNISYNDSLLAIITESQIHEIFNFCQEYNSKFIKVYFDCIGKQVKFIYSIDEELPSDKIYLKINNIPKYTRILNSTINNRSKELLIVKHENHNILTWLKQYSYYDNYTNKELINFIYCTVFVNQNRNLKDSRLSFENLAFETSYNMYN